MYQFNSPTWAQLRARGKKSTSSRSARDIPYLPFMIGGFLELAIVFRSVLIDFRTEKHVRVLFGRPQTVSTGQWLVNLCLPFSEPQ